MPWLARTLDWPFPGLGRFVEIAHMQGPAGEFYNVTWPGYVGALTAFAPGASPPRSTRRRCGAAPSILGCASTICCQCRRTLCHSRAIPPDQLLRQVFETARDYDAARRMLETTPIARPAIFTLAGCRAGERCVIERTEDRSTPATTITARPTIGSNSTPPWEGRIGASKVLTSTFEEAAEYSRARREGLALWRGSFARDSFGWVAPPVLNPYTRIAVEMCPARGILRGRLRTAGRRGIRLAGDADVRAQTGAHCGVGRDFPRTGCLKQACHLDLRAHQRALTAGTLACAASPLASAAWISCISSNADSREISTATRSRPPSASQMKSMPSAWSSGA